MGIVTLGLQILRILVAEDNLVNHQERCLAAGMDGYLSKPIRPQELDEALARCVARHHVTA